MRFSQCDRKGGLAKIIQTTTDKAAIILNTSSLCCKYILSNSMTFYCDSKSEVNNSTIHKNVFKVGCLQPHSRRLFNWNGKNKIQYELNGEVSKKLCQQKCRNILPIRWFPTLTDFPLGCVFQLKNIVLYELNECGKLPKEYPSYFFSKTVYLDLNITFHTKKHIYSSRYLNSTKLININQNAYEQDFFVVMLSHMYTIFL